MNAYELADCLEIRVVYGLPLKEAATMLRQLQEECDRLYRIIELNGRVWESNANERCEGK